jgi:GGDEF domain-containing protein
MPTMNPPLRLLAVGPAPDGLAASPWGPFDVRPCASLEVAAERLAHGGCDALLLCLPPRDVERVATWPALSQAVLDTAVVVVTERPDPALATLLLARGVQDLLDGARSDAEDVARALHLALGRRRLERDARGAGATDLSTGLPDQVQLLEHVNHLLALREREPAPMALLVVRVEGLAGEETGPEDTTAAALRRKLAVRLRASLRASDVVASVGRDAFAVLLARLGEPDAGAGVAAKLARTMARPLRVGGHDWSVALRIGVAQYPAHGRDAQSLLRRAFAQAVGSVVAADAGFARLVEGARGAAANDEAVEG